MQKKKAQDLLNLYLDKIIKILGLQRYEITARLATEKNRKAEKKTDEKKKVEPIDDDKKVILKGLCTRSPEYCEAEIDIYYQNITSVDDFKKTLAHEMCHIFLAEYTQYQAMVNMTLDEGGPLMKTLDESFRQVDELITSNLSLLVLKQLK